MRRRKRLWRPCSPGWPPSAARASRLGPRSLLCPPRAAQASGEPPFTHLLHYTCRGHCVWRRLRLHFCTPRKPGALQGRSSEGVRLSRPLQEVDCTCVLPGEGGGPLPHDAILRIDLVARMWRTLYSARVCACVRVCKTLCKWILINFCFNTWSHYRWSCGMDSGGVAPWPSPVLALEEQVLQPGAWDWDALQKGLLLCGCRSPAYRRGVGETLLQFCRLTKGCLRARPSPADGTWRSAVGGPHLLLRLP